jgi:hypothetical protein
MDALEDITGSHSVPAGYVAVPVTADQQRTPLRICLLVRQAPDPLGGQLVVLRDLAGARVYLGCVCDAAAVVRQWIELWVADLSVVDSPVDRAVSGFGAGGGQSNAAADRRWQALVAHDEIDPTAVIRSGWERGAPAAIFIDPAAREPFHPRGPSGAPLVLCRDDALLQRCQLPAYSTSRHRYLYDPAGDGRSMLVPASTAAPTSDRTRPLSDFFSSGRSMLPVNPAAAPMRVVVFGALTTEQLLEVLRGSAWAGVKHGRTRLQIGAPTDGVRDPATGDPAGGWLLGRRGAAGHLGEVFHLKLRLLAEMIQQVRSLAAVTRRPMLNLSPTSFRIDAPLLPSAGLPLLWTCRPLLVDPGRALALEVPGLPRPWFVAEPSAAGSDYQPARRADRPHGRGKLMIQQVRQTQGGVQVDAALQGEHPLTAGRGDLLWLRLPLPQRIELYAQVAASASAGASPLSFTTLAQPLPATTLALLQAAAGVEVAEVNYELLPAVHTPADLYSVALLGLHILLERPGEGVEKAVDELLSLAGQAAGRDPAEPLPQRVAAVLAGDEALAERLGRHRLVSQPSTAYAEAALPPELWWDTLAMLVRMLSGVGPDSDCAGLADVDPDQPHRVFDSAARAASSLVIRSRSLLLVDWQYNRQVHAVVRQLRARLP